VGTPGGYAALAVSLRAGPISLTRTLNVWSSIVARLGQVSRILFPAYRVSWDATETYRQCHSHDGDSRGMILSLWPERISRAQSA